MATKAKTSSANEGITGNRLALKRTLDHLMKNLDRIDGLVLTVEFGKRVPDPEGVEDSSDPTTAGYTVAIDARGREFTAKDDAPHCNCTTLTAGLAARTAQKITFRSGLFG